MKDIYCSAYSMIYDFERRQALIDLMMLPDESSMPPRRSEIKQPGKANRFDQLPLLAAAFVQGRLLELQEREALKDSYGAENKTRNLVTNCTVWDTSPE